MTNFRLIKKNFALLLCIVLLLFNIPMVLGVSDIQCNNLHVEGKNIICTVTLPEVKGNGAVLMITAKGKENIVYDDIYAIEVLTEKVSDINFVMPEDAIGDTNQQYSIIVQNGTDERMFDFYYVHPDIAADIMNNLRMTTRTDIEAFMLNETNGVKNSAALSSMGVKTDIYNGISDNVSLVWDLYYGKVNEFVQMSDEVLVQHINESIISGAINETGADITGLLTALNQSFEGTPFSKMADAKKQWIAQYVSDNLPVSISNTLVNIYDVANILYSFNNARTSDIASLITNYADETGIINSNYYSIYNSMNTTPKNNVADAMVTSLANSNADSTAELSTVFDSAVSSVNSAVGQPIINGGGGGAGGASVGGGGKPGVVVNSNTETPQDFVSEPFDDISSVVWAKEAILALNMNNVISGVGNRKFAPNETVTREQILKMILLASGFSMDSGLADFSDVDNREWYAPYIGKAVELEIAKGMGDGNFGIGYNITRQDAAVMIVRAIETINRQINTRRQYEPFADEGDISDYAKYAVRTLYMAEIINGKGKGQFAPKDTCTRAEAAKMIYDALVK